MHENTMKKRCAIDSSLSFKRLIQLAFAAIMAFAAGACQEPPYRTEVTPNAQGGVEVHRVAKNSSPAAEASPAPSAETPHGESQMTPADRAKRIAELESRIRAMNAEIERLKQDQ
jgi:TolA-binding protein